jgi:hypothetical protein
MSQFGCGGSYASSRTGTASLNVNEKPTIASTTSGEQGMDVTTHERVQSDLALERWRTEADRYR